MNFPRIESTALLVVDLQERLVPAMNNPCPVLDRSRLLLRGMAELGVDVLVTEQYPKGLGGTVPEIAELLPESSPPIAKTGFSAFVEPAFRTALAAKPRKTLVVAGIEAHVCVLQTVFDALNEGFEVILATDAVTSRKAADRELALKAARHADAQVLPAEAVLFLLLRDAKHPAFKTVSKLVR